MNPVTSGEQRPYASMSTLVEQLASSRINTRINGSITPATTSLSSLESGDRISEFEILRAESTANLQEQESKMATP